MSYDIAVWEGEPPADGDSAAQEFERLYEELMRSSEGPGPAIQRFVERLLSRYPDITDLDDDEIDASPWADGPLIGNAAGSVIYFSLTNSMAAEALAFIAGVAGDEGLICFDPQQGSLLG